MLNKLHYASEKLKFEVISRGTFEWLRRFSEGPKCQTYLTLILKSKQGPKKVKLPLKVSHFEKVRETK